MADLIVEIGTEELPAGYIRPAHQWFALQIKKTLAELKLAHQEISCDGTPRRMLLTVKGLQERQADLEEEVFGPKSQIAWDSSGALSKAGQGFLRGRGLSEADAYKKEGPKGEVIAAILKISGKETKELLPTVLSELLRKMPFPKKMRWRDEKDLFARPVRWIFARLGTELVPFTFAGVDSKLSSYGHSFHAPEEFTPCADIKKYKQQLEEKKVLLSFAKRRTLIAEQGADLAASIGGFVKEDEALLDLVSNLVEWPVPLLAKFDDRFLDVPQELLISEMREHQKYFAVVDKDGKLLPYFVFAAGSEAKNPQSVIEGNLRVITSRFEDGAFYYNTDLDTPLEERQEKLKNVLFERSLGTLFEKVERIEKIVTYLSNKLNFSKEVSSVAIKAASLCKNDIVSGVIGEFPELQGVMAKYYVLAKGESAAVAEAITDHYAPRNRQDQLAKSQEAAVVGIADRLDTLVGILGIGKAPTGSSDPFALRRSAIAIAETIIGHRFEIDLEEMFTFAAGNIESKLSRPKNEVIEQCLSFFEARLLGVLNEQLIKKDFPSSKDIADAVLSASSVDVNDALYRAECLAVLRRDQGEKFTDLSATFKRVSNILKKASKEKWAFEISLSADLVLEEELNLAKACQKILEADENEKKTQESYMRSFNALVELRPVIDLFFDGVMVMSEDENERFRRLSLLAQVNTFLKPLADFSRIQGV